MVSKGDIGGPLPQRFPGPSLQSNNLSMDTSRRDPPPEDDCIGAAYKAYSPARNMSREYLFWYHPFPLGVVDIPRKHLIDVDEFVMEAKSLSRSNAWGISF
eukprot:jgi/Psemu1/12659/gm1.12659_g